MNNIGLKKSNDIHGADNEQSGTAHTRQDIFALYNEDAVIYDTFPPTRPRAQGLPLPHGSVITQRPVFPTSPLPFELALRMSKTLSISPDVQDTMEYVISRCRPI